MRRCDNCSRAVLRDYGYSDYTVEGTTVSCSLDLNPGLPADRWYGENETLNFAKKCRRFNEGSPEHFTVEGYQD